MTATGHRALPPERPSAMVLSPALTIGMDHSRPRQSKPWSTGQLLALAWPSCPECLGTGGEADAVACNCVWESIFKSCFRRYRNCQQNDPRGYNRKDQEFVADFEQIAKRSLSPGQQKYFVRHVVEGHRPPRGEASHAMLRDIMRSAGRAFRETDPYPLFPVHDYFGEPVHLARKAERR